MNKIHAQLKSRRKALGMKQDDMMMRIGMSRQQYQRLESKGNPRLDTLELVAMGLKMEVMLVPKEKLRGVQAYLAGEENPGGGISMGAEDSDIRPSLADDPWAGLLDSCD